MTFWVALSPRQSRSMKGEQVAMAGCWALDPSAGLARHLRISSGCTTQNCQRYITGAQLLSGFRWVSIPTRHALRPPPLGTKRQISSTGSALVPHLPVRVNLFGAGLQEDHGATAYQRSSTGAAYPIGWTKLHLQGR